MSFLYTLPVSLHSLFPFLPPLPHPAFPRHRETMPSSSWICINNSKTMLIQIVHPGGHVEVHDRPVSAAEIMCRYPRCYVAYPYVFKQPWAVVEPDTMLVLGQKYYVVPKSTIRKLQRLSPMNSPSPAREIAISPSVYEIRNTQSSNVAEEDGVLSTCCVFKKKNTAKKLKRHSKRKNKKSKIRSDARNFSVNDNDKIGGLSNENCFASMLNGARTKANDSNMTKETRTSSSSAHHCDDNTLARKRTQDLTGNGVRSSPKKAWSADHWQPSLESITEE